MPEQSDKRRNTVRQAIANERLEGLKVSGESRKIAENYIVGKADAKQTAKQIRARYGVE
ncbi:MAG: antitoxin VbhA family protein [Solirubrobacterales bacterium]|nr:antitoxin VbhA family protein [Solirubrobacterales bacterium]